MLDPLLPEPVLDAEESDNVLRAFTTDAVMTSPRGKSLGSDRLTAYCRVLPGGLGGRQRGLCRGGAGDAGPTSVAPSQKDGAMEILPLVALRDGPKLSMHR